MTANLVILDRDGVINFAVEEAPIKSPDEWEPIPGSLEAIARLNQAGYRVIVATNQSGIGRGMYNLTALNDVHKKMQAAAHAVGANIDAIFFCPHAANEGCDCRKPKPGMLKEIAKRYDVNLQGIPLVGDSLRDIQAAFVAGCTPHLVLTGNGQTTEENGGLPPGTVIHPDLATFTDRLLKIGSDNSVDVKD